MARKKASPTTISVRLTPKQWEAVIGCLEAALSGPPDGDAFLDESPAEMDRNYDRARVASERIKERLDGT